MINTTMSRCGVLALLAATGLSGTYTVEASASSPLINPSAEDSPDTLPGWQGQGVAPVAYGADSMLPATAPGPALGGRLFRATTDGARIQQTITVDDVRDSIDAGKQLLYIAGSFGGPAGSNATTALAVRFLGVDGAELGSGQVGGPDDFQRTGQTRTLYCRTNLTLPRDTRRVEVALIGRGIGGFADRLEATTNPNVPDALPGTLYPSTNCVDPYIPPPYVPPPPPPPPGPRPVPPPVAPALRTVLQMPSAGRCIKTPMITVRLRTNWMSRVRTARLRARGTTTTLTPTRRSARIKRPRPGHTLSLATRVLLKDGRERSGTVHLRACRTRR